ncbi:hypothetical protein AB0D08_07080 [Kitasatospora sp. NPDC048540]|uniref:hypothetical protein n=1 Tax=unclassified Kitasatospora TaxID=2633591 RepID=UPI00053A9EA9|nr:hypothetical protein [Kitasatospora sp. MBT63]
MPDREPAARRHRTGSSSQSQSDRSPQRGEREHAPEWPYEGAGRPPRAGAHRMGIPRILGRRARWVGARLRREA